MKTIRNKLSPAQREKVRKSVEDQLRAIHPKMPMPSSQAQRKAVRENPDWLKPKWYREMTKRRFEAMLPHCRRGGALFQMGRDDGFLLGSLLLDQAETKKQRAAPKRAAYLRTLKADILACNVEKDARAAKLPPKRRGDYLRGFAIGLQWAQNQLAEQKELATDQLTRFWNMMPGVLTRCPNIPALFNLIVGRPAKTRTNDYDPSFAAFQKLCLRLGIKLRPRGRPRKA